MKKYTLLLSFVFLVIFGKAFSETIILDNQTSYPNSRQNSKIGIQFVSSAKETGVANASLMQGQTPGKEQMKMINQTGKTIFTLPENTAYFRVLVWTGDDEMPDLHTNWIHVTPNKTYTLKSDQLVPMVLMSGFGC